MFVAIPYQPFLFGDREEGGDREERAHRAGCAMIF